MQWIDIHVHIGEDRGGVSASADDVTELVGDTVDRAVVFCFDEVNGIAAGNAHIQEVVENEERLAGLFRVDPAVHEPGDLADAEWAAGFKLHPRSQSFTAEEVDEYVAAAAEAGKPVLVHTGLEEGEGSHPRTVLDAAEAHPDAAVVVAHTTKGYYFQSAELREQFQRIDNAYMDISLHCTPLGVERLAGDLGPDRVLFASDFPYGHPVPMQKTVELADIPEEEQQMVAAGNAERLFF